MSFILRWLGLRDARPEGFSVRPSRTLELPVPAPEAYDRCLAGLQEAVGANITHADRASGAIEASFGLVHSERIACTIQPSDAGSRVIIESRRIAGAGLSKASPVLDRLADWMQAGR